MLGSTVFGAGNAHRPVLGGDFNSNACWDNERRDWNHSTMSVAELRSRGLTSVYHTVRKQEHGKETAPTFHLQKNKEKDFHIDYVFAPDAWQQRLQMTVGNFSECESTAITAR